MRVRRFLSVALVGTVLIPHTSAAQATGDQPRLTLGIAAGAVTGKDLWSAAPQPVQFINPADTFGLTRRIRSTLAVSFLGTYFSNENLGFTGEAFLLGLGFEDSCRHIFSSGSTPVAEVCESIQGKKKAATSVVLSVGPIFRINSRKLFSPYARASVGLVLSNQSSLRTLGEFTDSAVTSSLVVYSDDKSSRLDPSLALGIGFTAAIAKGYGLRWEVRDNIVGVQRVTSTIPIAGFVPPHKRVFKHLFSMTFGFDVILERRRGRRY
jgi:hypothetical protein